MILRRLGEVGATLTEIRVDSVVTRRAAVDQVPISLRRHRLPLRLQQLSDYGDLKRDISTGAREPGAREGASRGGSSRRLRLVLAEVALTGSDLETALGGAGVAPDAEMVEMIVAAAAGRSIGAGQGFLLDPVVKRAVEGHAMELAIEFYSGFWTVKDVHADHSYDLECTRGEETLLVEVKGTTGRGETVIVTRNEVSVARERHPHTELFIISGIVVHDRGLPRPWASGGVQVRIPGWGVQKSRLEPLGFTYRTT